MSDTTVRYRGTSDVYRVQSWTDPDQAYEVLIGGVKSCTCPSFKYRKNPKVVCKHITEVQLQRESRRVGPEPGPVETRVYGTARIDVVDIMAKAFQNGLETGFEMARKVEKSGFVR